MITVNLRARYAIYGGMIGDSLGSSLEFTNSTNAKNLITKYSNFDNGLIGKGPFDLCSGQITDDSEMALAIMFVISQNGEYNQEITAKIYHMWYNSHPFDIGNTTQIAVSNPTYDKMIQASRKLNATSLSNGFLMRLYGLVAMYYGKSSEDLINAIIKDVELTHSHPEVKEIAVIYGMMLYKAIRNENADRIYQWGKNHCSKSKLVFALYNTVDNYQTSFVYNNETYDISHIDSKNTGFVGFAFWLLLQAIKNHRSYRDAILEVVGYGGDTDTNACIVGAVIGALYPDTIPTKWIESLLNCSAKKRYINYPIADPKVWSKWLP